MLTAHGTVIILSTSEVEKQTKSMIAAFVGKVSELQEKLRKQGF